MHKDNTTTVIPKEDLQSAVSNSTIKGVLTRVFKLFLVAHGKDKTAVWNQLMDRYVADPTNNIPNDRSKQTSAKGNAKREYLAPQLSWTKFCEAMRFADFESLEIHFMSLDRSGERMHLTEVIQFEDAIDTSEENDLVNANVKPFDPEYSIAKSGAAGGDARDIAINGAKKPVKRGRDWMLNSDEKPKSNVDRLIDMNTVTTSTPINVNQDVPY